MRRLCRACIFDPIKAFEENIYVALGETDFVRPGLYNYDNFKVLQTFAISPDAQSCVYWCVVSDPEKSTLDVQEISLALSEAS